VRLLRLSLTPSWRGHIEPNLRIDRACGYGERIGVNDATIQQWWDAAMILMMEISPRLRSIFGLHGHGNM
jgi:hypothetical protein